MSVNVKLGNETINNVDTVRLRSADNVGEYCDFQEKIDVPYVEYTMDESTQKMQELYCFNFEYVPQYFARGNVHISKIDLTNSPNCTSLMQYCMDGMSQLQTLLLPNSIQEIGLGALASNERLSFTSLPHDLQTIGQNAFKYCRSFDIDALPNGLQSIGYSAFENCTSLSSLTDIPDGVESIGPFAFGWCSALKSIRLPSSLIVLQDSLFVNCANLQDVVIRGGTTLIKKNVFNNCTSLMSVTCEAVTPPTLQSNAFTNVPPTCAIYVPADSVDTYKAATNWSERADYIQAIPEE